jgi:hypothetical protein
MMETPGAVGRVRTVAPLAVAPPASRSRRRSRTASTMPHSTAIRISVFTVMSRPPSRRAPPRGRQ